MQSNVWVSDCHDWSPKAHVLQGINLKLRKEFVVLVKKFYLVRLDEDIATLISALCIINLHIQPDSLYTACGHYIQQGKRFITCLYMWIYFFDVHFECYLQSYFYESHKKQQSLISIHSKLLCKISFFAQGRINQSTLKCILHPDTNPTPRLGSSLSLSILCRVSFSYLRSFLSGS